MTLRATDIINGLEWAGTRKPLHATAAITEKSSEIGCDEMLMLACNR